MRNLVPVIAAVVISLAGSALLAQELPELKVVKVEIVPNSERDLESAAFFRGRPIIEAAPAPDKGGERLQLPSFRSYRLIVTVQIGKGKTPSSVLVRTECVRDGKTVVLGKTHIGIDGRIQYACYDIYPGSAEPGDCVIRTIVEADTETKAFETKALEFKATIAK
jgi:hypothetical protein